MPEQLPAGRVPPASPPVALSWTCARCAVTASWAEGSVAPAMPANWVKEGDECHCLGCRREMAGEAAVVVLGNDAPVDQRQRQRSHARIEFEIGRDPSRPDNKIAKSCHTSAVAVRKARARMGLDARPPRPSDRDTT